MIGGRSGVCAATRGATANTISAITATKREFTAISSANSTPTRTIRASAAPLIGLATFLLPDFLLHEKAGHVIEDPDVRFLPAVQHHTHLPWPGEDFQVFDRDFVVDVVGTRHRIALNQMQRLAVKIAGAIEPRLVREVDGIDDECVA